MDQLSGKQKQTVEAATKDPQKKLLRRMLIFSMTTLIFGLIGYFIFHTHWIRLVLVHVGALGVLGLLACLAGSIAGKKGFNCTKAVLWGFLSPIFFGIALDYLIDPPQENGLPSSCGGIVSLGVALVVVIIYFFRKSKKK